MGNLKILLHIAIIVCILNSCTVQKKSETDNLSNRYIKLIAGKWDLTTNELSYPGLSFKPDSTAIFNSWGDTIYYFSYRIKGKTLVLYDNNHKKSENKISKLTMDSLIFTNLLEYTEPQVYIRKLK